MRKALLTTAAAIAMVAAIMFFGVSVKAAAPASQVIAMNQLEQEVFDEINTTRASYGLSALKVKSALISDARVRASESALVWSHTRPDGSDWWTVDDKEMYSECLAKGYDTAESIVEAWMTSTTHRAELLRADLVTAGIGGFVDSNGNCYVTFEGGF